MSKDREDSPNPDLCLYGRGTGKSLDSDGYVLIRCPEHPRARTNGYVCEHIIVLEEKLGRSLTEDEECDHINQIRTDNRPENLRVLTKAQHRKRHHAIDMSSRRCSRCGGTKTQLQRGKYIRWFKADKGYWCRNCYEYHRRHNV